MNFYRDKIILNGRIKSDNIRRNTEGENVYPGKNWRWGTKVWGSNRIRDPGSPYRKLWVLNVYKKIKDITANALKHSAWGVRSQDWNLKEMTGARH